MTQHTAEITSFIENVTHPLKQEIASLRDIILGANADITEHIKWNAPSFCYNDEDRVTMNFHKQDRVVLVFHRGAKVKDSTDFHFEDASGLMEWASKDRALVTFYTMQEIADHTDALKNIVSRWMLT